MSNSFDLIKFFRKTRGSRMFLHFLIQVGTRAVSVVVPVAAWKFSTHFSKELARVSLYILQRLSVSEEQLNEIMADFEKVYAQEAARYYSEF